MSNLEGTSKLKVGRNADENLLVRWPGNKNFEDYYYSVKYLENWWAEGSS